MEYRPRVDLSKYDLLTACDILYKEVRAQARAWGMDPDIECALFSAAQSKEMGFGIVALLAMPEPVVPEIILTSRPNGPKCHRDFCGRFKVAR